MINRWHGCFIFFIFLENSLESEMETHQRLNELTESNEKELLQGLADIVPRAKNHSILLNDKSLTLESLLINTRDLSGVKAASVYENIANSMKTALQFADDAAKAAANTTNMVYL